MSSYRKMSLAAMVIVFAVIVVAAIATTNRVDAPVTQSTVKPTKTVDAAIAERVKAKCVAQIKIISRNNKPSWTVTGTSFTGDVKEVALLRKKTAYEVTFTYSAQGESPVTKKCRVDSTFESVEMFRL